MTTLCVFGFVLKDEVVFLDVAPVVAGFVSRVEMVENGANLQGRKLEPY